MEGSGPGLSSEPSTYGVIAPGARLRLALLPVGCKRPEVTLRRSLAPENILMALQSGDVDPLLKFHRDTFGDLRMEDDPAEDAKKDDETEDDAEDAGGAADDAKKDDEKLDPRVKQLSDENAKRRNEAKALKKQNDELAAKLKAIEDKDKSELDKATGGLTEAQAKAEQLAAKNQELLIQNAFLMDNKHSWANPKAALKLADLSEVEIDDEGTVSGLREALDKLAKSDPYLLARAKDDEDDGPTGQPMGSRPRGNPSRDKLLEKYPALRR